jgi:hypothetical protein
MRAKATAPSLTADSVIRTRNKSRISRSVPSDFVCGGRQVAAEPAFPYCLDFWRRRAIYAAGLDPRGVQAAPFYYLYLRQYAQSVLRIGFDALPLSASGSEEAVFLFSPGRCGSTLLSRVLFEAAIPSVSEPDFYTQVADRFWSSRLNPLRPAAVRAMWAMTGDLGAALGGTPVVKLRAECCRAPHLFLRGEAPRSIMLFRGFESWSRSTAQAFGAGPGKAVRKYQTALDCYAYLRAHSRCHLMRYEDWLSDPAAAAAALGRFLGRSIPAEAVARACSTPSQAGTPLENRLRPGWEAKWRAALDLWQSPSAVKRRARLALPPILDLAG